MSDTKEPWQLVEDPDYYRAVMRNMVALGVGNRNPDPCAQFGDTGQGIMPNYQITDVDGVTHCFRGSNHKEDVRVAEAFAKQNLSDEVVGYREMEARLAELLGKPSA